MYLLLTLRGIGAAGGDSGRISGTGETPGERSEGVWFTAHPPERVRLERKSPPQSPCQPTQINKEYKFLSKLLPINYSISIMNELLNGYSFTC